MSIYLSCLFTLLALINPISKIFIVSTLSGESKDEEIRKICVKASFVASCILLLFALVGNSLLTGVFHVNLYAFQMVGGIILFLRGILALNKGLFFEIEANQKLEDVSIVPLASPMIAGPATITAAVSFPSHYGMLVTLLAIAGAILLNLVIMFYSRVISDYLKKYNLMGALIRITGLIVATIGAQMLLDGLSVYIVSLSTN